MADRHTRTDLPTASAQSALAGLWRLATGLALPSGPSAAARYPDVRLLPANPSHRDLEALARCFCAIYASSERAEDGDAIWGEGWRCRWCGTEHGVDVGSPCPACGAEEQEVLNDREEIRRMLLQVLKPRPEWFPVACVLERGEEIVGFAFGAVTTPKRAVAHLGQKLLEYTPELEACGVDLSRIDLKAALPATSPVFYMDELCLLSHCAAGSLADRSPTSAAARGHVGGARGRRSAGR